MAFKDVGQSVTVPDSPEKLFLDLPRRKIPSVFPYQQELMRSYVEQALDKPDVALQLPTGSGKTLVGLLIAEWRRRKFNEKVVYLAPTKQLVNQVTEQAEEKYGISVHSFTGSSKDYDPASRADYKSGARIAVTTYSSLFNTSPFFNDADIIILDDTHAAENYISTMWSLRIERTNPEHEALHTAFCAVLKPLLAPYDYTRLMGDIDNPSDWTWTDKLSTPEFVGLHEEITTLLDAHTKGTDLSYAWQLLKGHLDASHLYFSSQEILIRPLIPPTWTHAAFSNAKQRIYMSATLGSGGDMERLVGRAPIVRLPVAEGWDVHGVGRRFFVFPGMSLDDSEVKALRRDMMGLTERSLILVPSTRVKDEIQADIKTNTTFQIFGATDIESSKKTFIETASATAIVANRYDGIDFPGEECRLLFVDGLPRATNIQERFLMSRMSANVLFNERIQTRVLQAIGRCTRSLEDYSAVIVTGGELVDYLVDTHRREYFHPELQAELHFGVEQSKEIDATGLLDNLRIFLENGEEWEKVSQQIVVARKGMTKKPFPAMDDLQASAVEEIEYQKKLWQKDFEQALSHADLVLGVIKHSDLRGYRALWHYLAGCAAWLDVNAGGSESLKTRAIDEFGRAKEAAPMLPWLVALTRYSAPEEKPDEEDSTIILEQVERMEAALLNLGTAYDKSYVLREKEILEGIVSKNHIPFENAHKLLGNMLGFESDNTETEGAPDPWWISSRICLVFEDHAGADASSSVDVTKARQVSSHPAWIRKNIPAAADAEILPVLVTPVAQAKEAAMPHLETVAVWKLDDFQVWARDAVATVREIRKNLTTVGNLVWRAETMTKLKEHGLDAVSLMKKLRAQQAVEILKPIK